MKANEFVKKHGLVESKKHLEWMVGVDARQDIHGWFMDDLKRLVEAHEMVKDYYGLTKAKEHAESNYTAPEIKDALKQAIADVEACKEVYESY